MALQIQLGGAILPGKIIECPHRADLVFDLGVDDRMQIVLIAMELLGGFAGVDLYRVRRIEPEVVAVKTQNCLCDLEDKVVRHYLRR